jgi:plastocyanin
VLVGAVATVSLMAPLAQPAHAIHLFPLTPVFDPLGHDCAKNLVADLGTSAATTYVAGFNFIDAESHNSTTTIAAGESVTWKWLADHCHSVTFSPTMGTVGAAGFMPAQPELVRKNGDADSFTLTFPEAGEFSYLCVHHGSVGMQGTVVVTG